MNQENNPNGLSAVAARRLGLSNQTQLTQTNQHDQSTLDSKEQDFDSIHSIKLNSDEETDDENQSNQSLNQSSPEKPKKKSRYFTNPSDTKNPSQTESETPLRKKSSHLPSSSSSKFKNLNQFKRKKVKSTFSDLDCVSNWEPNWFGDQQNVMIYHDHQNQDQDHNHNQNQSIIIGIQLGENLIFRGTLFITVLIGTIEINGARLESGKPNQSLKVFAPMSHPLPILTTLKSSTVPTRTRTSIDLDLNVSNFDAIIRIEDLQTGIEGIDSVWSSNGPKRPIWNQSNSPNPETKIMGQTWDLILTLTPETSSLKLPKTWLTSLSNLSNPIGNSQECYLIQGPKGVGKSTFIRLLLNKLLDKFEQIALLDLDPGQPLFTPPSIISLHLINKPLIGPSFCFQSIPQSSLRSHYLGNLSPIESPTRYLEALEDLISFYKFEFHQFNDHEPVLLTTRQRRKHQASKEKDQNPIQIDQSGKCTDRVPILVNTMGWTTGLGFEFLNKIRELLNPSRIYTFENQERVNEREDEEKRKMEYLEPIGDTPLSLRLPAHESRTLNLISYLYSTNSNDDVCSTDRVTKFFDQWDFETRLHQQRPMMIRSNEISIELLDESIPNSHLPFVLNGSLVSLLSSTDSNCLGLALIRSIDPIQGMIYLISPCFSSLKEEEEAAKMKIVKGFEPCLPLNVLVYENGDQEVKVFLEIKDQSLGNHLVGFEKKRVRRNVMRWSQRGH
ncbi:hypothetical protein DFH28DRAFT_973909 [Melampsora americana]|nr:hypothetical protein DFH28DRAFT_973909 [Melampsora americana]